MQDILTKILLSCTGKRKKQRYCCFLFFMLHILTMFNAWQLAKLPPEDMSAVTNMRLLGAAPDSKKSSLGSFSLKFDIHKVKLSITWLL